MSRSEWQCTKCKAYLCISIQECIECNEYDKDGFNGYYCDEEMTLITYKWIKSLEEEIEKLKEGNKLLRDGLSRYSSCTSPIIENETLEKIDELKRRD